MLNIPELVKHVEFPGMVLRGMIDDALEILDDLDLYDMSEANFLVIEKVISILKGEYLDTDELK